MTVAERQSGYAVMEVLIATVIAAAVVGASMAGFAGAVRAVQRADERQEAMIEARNILARLEAGIPASVIAPDYPDWRIEIRPHDRPVDPRTGAVVTRVRVVHRVFEQLEYQQIYVEPGPLPASDGAP